MHDLNCLDPVLAAKKIVKNSLRPIDIAEVKYGRKIRLFTLLILLAGVSPLMQMQGQRKCVG